MKLDLKRIALRPSYTIGRLMINGQYFCDTIEDTVRDLSRVAKVPGKTAIPAGEYEITLTHSPRFGKIMPLVNNVPHFSGIRIHSGNTADDTEGCIIVGKNKTVGAVVESRVTYAALYEKLTAAVRRGERITIRITDK